jgi:hypothetical protein
MKSTQKQTPTTPVDVFDLIRKSEAARLRGVRKPAITYLIHKRQLDVFNVGGVEFVSRSQVLGLKDKRKENRAA